MKLQTMPLRFRVWDKERGKFITPEPVDDRKWLWIEELAQLIIEHPDWFGDEKNARCIISQDTGFKDKNGNSIFTGDKLRYEYPGEEPQYGRVEYSAGGIMQFIHYNRYTQHDRIDKLCAMFIWSVVVSNIWQNPESLERQNV